MSDVDIVTCKATGVSELYWDGGRTCIDLGNDINEETANSIFLCIKNHDRLKGALTGILNIVSDSDGVVGYHQNGDVATWDEFDEIKQATALLRGLEHDNAK
ncbi:hypothetical protein ACP6H7_00630 [Vibrio harveyi]|uniref:hypothetical protein n=1 Tax=Vibrio harveyi TaxID=669 RepID=UPI003CF74727